jgi:hypothetical protein
MSDEHCSELVVVGSRQHAPAISSISSTHWSNGQHAEACADLNIKTAHGIVPSSAVSDGPCCMLVQSPDMATMVVYGSGRTHGRHDLPASTQTQMHRCSPGGLLLVLSYPWQQHHPQLTRQSLDCRPLILCWAAADAGTADGDGQYYHYLTKWAFALERLARLAGEPHYLGWAVDLMTTAHRSFLHTDPR